MTTTTTTGCPALLAAAHRGSTHYFETRVPLIEDPVTVAARLARAGLHDSYVVLEQPGRWRFAAGTRAEVTLDRDGARLRTEAGVDTLLPWGGCPFQLLAKLLQQVEVPGWRAYGWIGFELAYARATGRTYLGSQRLAHLIVPRAEVLLEDGMAALRAADQPTMDALLAAVAPASTPDPAPRPLPVRGVGEAAYTAAVAGAVADIHAGRLQKVILSRVVEVDTPLDLPGTYLAGRRGNRPARSFLLSLDGLEATGFSPEIVVAVTADGQVVSQPLAGTRPLTGDPDRDKVLRDELLACPKEIYEHAISVKTAADELEPICQPGSVQVPEFMGVRERGSVQHLASQVAGRLAPGRTSWDAFAAVFPAVTASGVPKAEAYEAIRRHEPEPRGLYGGAVVTIDHTGEMDAALVLRTAYRQQGRTWLRAGAGIVGASTPDREYEETCEKLDSVARFLVPAEGPQ